MAYNVVADGTAKIHVQFNIAEDEIQQHDSAGPHFISNVIKARLIKLHLSQMCVTMGESIDCGSGTQLSWMAVVVRRVASHQPNIQYKRRGTDKRTNDKFNSGLNKMTFVIFRWVLI